MRLDVELFSRGYFESRQKAKYAIENKRVYVNNTLVTKVSFEVGENDSITVLEDENEFVSRAGNKLNKAIFEFNLDPKDKIMLDIGASTGGFTDCALKHGAKLVYAVDVGTNQLHSSLRNNDKVVSVEQLNFRYATNEDLNNTMFDIVTIDVSFISLEIILDNVKKFLKDDAIIIGLIKPQFELYEQSNRNKGIITSKNDHIEAISKVINHIKELGLYVTGLTFSPILGEKKENIEFLVMISNKESKENYNIQNVVNLAHKTLK